MQSSEPATKLYSIDDVKHAILSVQQEPEYESSLHKLLTPKVTLLKSMLRLNEGREFEQLTQFIQAYIDRCPDCLELCQELAAKTFIEPFTHLYIHAATEYFLDAHPVINSLSGNHAFLCRAYLCHRMLEELNDQVMLERRWPLAPVDMSHVNLIVHTLIGDEQANLLDQTILIRMELIRSQLNEDEKTVFQQEKSQQQLALLCQQGWKETKEQWPFLNEDIAAAIL